MHQRNFTSLFAVLCKNSRALVGERWRKVKWLLAFSVLLLAGLDPAYAVVAGGMVSNSYTVPAVAGGYTNMSADVRVTREPGVNGNTFWATQFFYGDGTGGYIGMQQNDGSTKIAIFSIWNATGWSSAYNANCSNFGSEGSGVSCKVAYPWVQGHKYRFNVLKTSSSALNETWAGQVTDLGTGTTQTIGEIQQGVKAVGLTSISQFVENFAQGSEQYSSCSQVPAAVAIFSGAQMGGSALKVSGTQTYGNCAPVAQSYCTSDDRCVALVNSSAPAGNYRLMNGINNLCTDTLSGGSNLGLWTCAAGNAEQTLATTSIGQLSLPLRSLCLQGSSSGVQVSAQACSANSSQAWVPYASSGALFNVGAETCLDAAGGAILGAKVQSYSCTDSAYQHWVAVP